MNRLPLEIGSVAVSTAGRDQGRIYAVFQELDADFVLVVDGKLRSIDRPKKKRRKHLRATGNVLREMARRLNAGEIVQDHELRAWLKEEEG